MPKGSVDYQKGLIYAIYSKLDPTQFYIGSTTNIDERWKQHRYKDYYKCNSILHRKMKEDGRENFYIELYEYFPCNSKRELERKEGEIQRLLKPALNKNIAGRTTVEYSKDYYSLHKNKILENHKNWGSEIVKCECGGNYTKTNKSRHLNSKKHQQYLSLHDKSIQ
jgi:group I intron endonuclease